MTHIGLSRRLTMRVCFCAALMAVAPDARAQDAFPKQSVTIIVPYAAGGGVDTVARVIADELRAKWNKSVVVENVPGASGMIAAARVTRATPDGHTILLAAAGEISVNPHLLKGKMTYDPATGLAPIAFAARIPNVLVVGKNSGLTSFAAFVERAKANSVSYATSGIGNPQHLAGALLSRTGDLKLNHIPYKGAAQQTSDVMAGHVEATFASVAAVKPFTTTDRLVPLAVTSAERIPAMPDVPAIGEHPAFPGYELVNWFGFFAPGKTPAPVIASLHAAISEALAKPAVQERLTGIGAYSTPMTPEQFKSFVQSETEKFGAIIERSKITAEE
jgi:tripartite-type tricarboxylate transporter receptor subunit TctC